MKKGVRGKNDPGGDITPLTSAAGREGGSADSIASRCGSSHGGSTSCSPRCSSIFIGGEARSFGRELEQHAARLEKVDRLEPESIDDFRRPTVRFGDALAHFELDAFVGDAPRDVMHRAYAPCAARRVRQLADLDVLARAAAANAVAMPAILFAVAR